MDPLLDDGGRAPPQRFDPGDPLWQILARKAVVANLVTATRLLRQFFKKEPLDGSPKAFLHALAQDLSYLNPEILQSSAFRANMAEFLPLARALAEVEKMASAKRNTMLGDLVERITARYTRLLNQRHEQRLKLGPPGDSARVQFPREKFAVAPQIRGELTRLARFVRAGLPEQFISPEELVVHFSRGESVGHQQRRDGTSHVMVELLFADGQHVVDWSVFTHEMLHGVLHDYLRRRLIEKFPQPKVREALAAIDHADGDDLMERLRAITDDHDVPFEALKLVCHLVVGETNDLHELFADTMTMYLLQDMDAISASYPVLGDGRHRRTEVNVGADELRDAHGFLCRVANGIRARFGQPEEARVPAGSIAEKLGDAIWRELVWRAENWPVEEIFKKRDAEGLGCLDDAKTIAERMLKDP
jgi:hypothetical protein